MCEKATKFEKTLSYFWQEHRVLCVQQLTCQKVDDDFSKQMWSSRIIQNLPGKIKKIINVDPRFIPDYRFVLLIIYLSYLHAWNSKSVFIIAYTSV